MHDSACYRLLIEEFTSRQTRNRSYSLRAFARDLGIGSTSLSDFFTAKRQLSKRSRLKIASALRLSPLETQEILSDSSKFNLSIKDNQRLTLEEDTFRLIADWYYLAILNLAKFKENRATAQWVAARLGIPVPTARAALQRLERMGLLKSKQGRMFRTVKPLSTTRDIPSAAIRKHHADNLLLAEKSLLNDPLDSREFSSITMAISPKRLMEAKDILMKTKRKVAELLDDSDPSEVYVLSFQLFPLTKLDRPRSKKGRKTND